MMKVIEKIGRGIMTSVGAAKAVCDKHNRSMPDWLLDDIRGREEIRIAILGAKKSGKTVLWTAVENYIRYLESSTSDQDKATLGGWKVFEVEQQEPFGWPDFDYGTIRAKLAETDEGRRDWPKESDVVWCRALDVSLKKEQKGSKPKWRKVRLRVLDIPGERFSDIGTMYGRSFEKWSCDLDSYWRKTPNSLSIVHSGYVKSLNALFADLDRIKGKKEDLIQQVEKVERECFAKYREYLKEAIGSYSHFITPSTYILTDESLPEERRVLREGLYGDSGFVPIPKEAFAAKGKGVRLLIKRFAAAYLKYKKDMKINEVAEWFETANQAYYLVDVLAILQNGRTAKESVLRQINNVGNLFSNCNDRLYKKAWKFLFKTQINKVCAVVAQADRTNLERDEENLKKLAKDLFCNLFAKIAGVATDCFVCSAVRAATPSKETGMIECSYKVNRNEPKGPGNLYSEPYSAPQVPAKWGDVWDANGKWNRDGGWYYPEPLSFPKDYESVPLFFNLDLVVKSMLLPEHA